MTRTARDLWQRYEQYRCVCPSVGMSLDVSRINFADDFFDQMQGPIGKAFEAMKALELGAIANPDEKRMVGHYWLRAPQLAPDSETKREISRTIEAVKAFAAVVHKAELKPQQAAKFTDVLLVGIGGSALGPQLVADALGDANDRMRIHFFDNTDPDGFDRTLAMLGERINSTLTIVISKSGGTKETRNGMLEAKRAYDKAGLDFGKHAVAVTQEGSALDKVAEQEGWLERFPMWDYVGGRTSVTSAVGLLPAALQGIDIDALLQGAADMDQVTRVEDARDNPAALLALMWYSATNGKGEKDMVILPYKDRLLLMSRYLQQLIMESLGKQHDLAGNIVDQGIAVYGNKGSTDQHAFVQQLRDGLDNFFVTFIVVLKDRAGDEMEVEDNVTAGDYLNGFWQGTRSALTEKGRQSITLTIDEIDAKRLGSLIALYERAVGFYATLVNINAYHQPGVEAGKKAAAAVLDVQHKVLAYLRDKGAGVSPDTIAETLGLDDQVETVHHIVEHLIANGRV